MKVDILLSVELQEGEDPEVLAADVALTVALGMQRDVWGSVADGIEFDPFVRNRVQYAGYDRYGRRLEERRRLV